MKFKDYFSNDFETSDNHYLPSLRSRYYRCRTNEALEAIKKLALQEKAAVKYFDEERNEVVFDAPNYSVTATITRPSHFESAVDLKIITYAILPLGKGKKIIEDLYIKLDKIIPYRGAGLQR